MYFSKYLDLYKPTLSPRALYASRGASIPQNLDVLHWNWKTIWATSWQNQQNDLCILRRLRPAWASSRSYQSLRCALNGYLRTQCFYMQAAKTSDWADAQADLSVHWAHRSFCWFCHEMAHHLIRKGQRCGSLSEPHHAKTCLRGFPTW